jgi:protein arginine kinase activator
MICSVCQKNEAKVHVTQIVDDKVQKVDLCEECSKAKGMTDPKGFSLADLLLGLGASQEAEPRASKPGEVCCPGCGLTQSEFKKAGGRFGCPQCYTAFAEELPAMLRTMHKGLRHVGKVPQALRPRRDPADLLKSLNRRLEKAVQAENFEEAAQLRDAIRALKPPTGSVT